MMTTAQLDAIRERLTAVSNLPNWEIDPDPSDSGEWVVTYRDDGDTGLVATVPDHGYAVAELIADAPAGIAALLAEVDELTDRAARLQRERDEARADRDEAQAEVREVEDQIGRLARERRAARAALARVGALRAHRDKDGVHVVRCDDVYAAINGDV
ncbi:hypothetical protein [Marinactinospora rubrisoli]|uniref:Uncharacterized protein n=1 Tax=Marinactinospora rubrisoli TaxID=2715399 RepID=A0ABW2KNF4_9ACTN